MKKIYLQTVSLLILFLSSTLRPVVWNGTIDFTNSVINEDLEIQGNVTFAGTQPITIVVNDGNTYTATLNGWDTFIEGDGSQVPLNIIVINGRFRFVLDNTLTFRGLNDQPFFMTATGGGVVEFQVHGDRKLIFDAPTLGKPGALFYVDMNDNQPSVVEFTRGGDKNKHAEIVVGSRSAIGFMAETKIENAQCDAQEEGIIRFVTGNSGIGRYVLRIKDRGALIATGQHKTGGGDIPTFNDLDRSTPAGREALVEIINKRGANNDSGSLLVINENKTFSRLLINPFDEAGGYTGILYGFILGVNGVLNVQNCAYLDYVGTTVNGQPTPNIPEDILDGRTVSDVVRIRNASALIVDGFDSSCAHNAKIQLDGTSAVYFRSGVDAEGTVEERTFDDQGNEIFFFVISPETKNEGLGNVVLDVEGPLDVQGSLDGSTALNILSLQVNPTGGTVALDDTKKLFPLRTFERDIDDQLLAYNKADFFFNNRMNLFETVLRHDDRNHEVFENNSPRASEPTYVGGETFLLLADHNNVIVTGTEFQRPRIVLYNSRIDLHESAAFMGVDIFVPNLVDLESLRKLDLQDDVVDSRSAVKHRQSGCPGVPQDNVSALRFFNNGLCLDNGTGRQLILGTNFLVDCSDLVSCDAHLDIMQEVCQRTKTQQVLRLEIGYNNATIREEIADQEPIQGQLSIHTIYLGCSSNISIGTDGDTGTDSQGVIFALVNEPTLLITESFFSFDTQGGPERLPELGGTTGKGAIFVDMNGVLKIENKRANFSAMVVKSHNGIIDLPKRNVFFNSRIGITEWALNLADPDERVIVQPGECFSSYTLDWINVCKDVCNTTTSTGEFDPFDPSSIPQCRCEDITVRNIDTIPTIQGEVDQFLVKRSRFGDQVHLKIDGTNSCNALIRELIYLNGFDSAEAPVGVIVLKGNGRIGLGSANRNFDSTQTSTVVGINGTTIIPDGNGTVDLNEDLIIDNICHILPGPNFGRNPQTGVEEEQFLTFCSNVPRAIRVKSTGVLNLSQLGSFQNVRFAGEARLVLEPGARILFNADPLVTGRLQFADMAQMRFECGDTICPIANIPNVTSTDQLRVKISGRGIIEFRNDSQMILTAQTIVGIESDPTCAPETNITLIARDGASLLIGPENELGGALQVGNTTAVRGGVVDFELLLDGLGANLQINSEGYLGFGAGIVAKPSGSGTSPSDMRIGVLQQVRDVVINIIEGTFQHNIIESSNTGVDSDESPAGTLAFGPVGINGDGGYDLTLGELVDIRILGGGNIINIGRNVTDVRTIIDTQDGLISGSVAAGTQIQVGTLSSLNVFLDNGQPGGVRNQVFPNGINGSASPLTVNVGNLTNDVMYGILKTPPVNSMQQPRGNIAIDSLNESSINYVFNSTIMRILVTSLTGPLGIQVESSEAHPKGAVGLQVNSSGRIQVVTLLLGQ